MSDSPAKPAGRAMKYPYTYSAKIAQFPYKFYFTNSWLYKYWLVGLVVSMPVFYKVHKAGMYHIELSSFYLFIFSQSVEWCENKVRIYHKSNIRHREKIMANFIK